MPPLATTCFANVVHMSRSRFKIYFVYYITFDNPNDDSVIAISNINLKKGRLIGIFQYMYILHVCIFYAFEQRTQYYSTHFYSLSLSAIYLNSKIASDVVCHMKVKVFIFQIALSVWKRDFEVSKLFLAVSAI